ncbi:hypothetical protein WICMUC_003313 [Wickerhamomyces mucosus]|uniref:DNA repair protein REV1 n=1 Tax=Wickerhamomyces mucosus TaxID=1378264 RepID=A0A9P8PN10_9ASCO|nr:hypothetical protein WICMUC_003313 [Wickerhamomyces mucosus]
MSQSKKISDSPSSNVAHSFLKSNDDKFLDDNEDIMNLTQVNKNENSFVGNLSQLSDRSFLTSLDDNELLNLLNDLSQRKDNRSRFKNFHAVEPSQTLAKSYDVFPLSEEKKESTQDEFILQSSFTEPPSENSTLGTFQLAQVHEQLNTQANSNPQIRQRDQDLDSKDKDADLLFGDYATYFAQKGINQQMQDEQYLAWDAKRRQLQDIEEEDDDDSLLTMRSEIFKHQVIYVNGFTKPGITTIHKLVILNGGKFVHHMSSKGQVTHIIAGRLTPKKHVEFRNYKVCRPDWIVDSVKNGKLMNWSDYSVIEVEYGQKRLNFGNEDKLEDRSEERDDDDEEDDDVVVLEKEDKREENKEENHDEDLIYDEVDIRPLTQEDVNLITDNIDQVIDSKHPDFLKVFFSKSRLHHLSTWKQNLKFEFLQKALNQSEKSIPKKYTNSKDFKIIIHVDFDCFFATASALNYPDLDFRTKPVCVSHGGTKSSSTADISSCNYVCRKFGIKNGMWLRSAIKLCPDLICLDYDFPKYEEISKKFYDILIGINPDCIFPVSIDEALLDISSLIDENDYINQAKKFCEDLRTTILQKTNCSASIGCSYNVLLAKLSLKKAKPGGVFHLYDNVDEFLDTISVEDLPGLGSAIKSKLVDEIGKTYINVGDLRKLELEKLEKLFGMKTGRKLFDYSRGVDSTNIDISKNPKEFMRKSISIDINWGIRFDTIDQVDLFLYDLAKEIHIKLQKLSMLTSNLTLKILQRALNATVDPPKYLGCGNCDSYSRSSRLGIPTDDYRILGTEARSLYRSIGCDPIELRGIAIHVNKLIAKDEVVKQNQLPFAKIDFETFSRNLELDKPVAATKQSIEEKVNVTQYEIPRDADSSIIEQLPSTMKESILRQKNLNNQPVVEISKEVNIEVFNELPLEIQQEIKGELRRRFIKINSGIAGKSSHYQQIFTSNGTEFVKVSTPKKKKLSPKKFSPRKSPHKDGWNSGSPSPSPSHKKMLKIEKFDENVLDELPTSLRENIIEEYKFYESVNETGYSKIKKNMKCSMKPLNIDTSSIDLEECEPLIQPIKFQKLKRPKEILQILDRWLENSVEVYLSEKDFRIFDKYVMNLQNKDLYLLIIERIQQFVKISKENGVQLPLEWVALMSKYLHESDRL